MSRSEGNHLFSPFHLWAAKYGRRKSHHHTDWRQHRLIFSNLSWVLNAAQQPLKWSPNSFLSTLATAVLPEPPVPLVPPGSPDNLGSCSGETVEALGGAPAPTTPLPIVSGATSQHLCASQASCPLAISSRASCPLFFFFLPFLPPCWLLSLCS